MVDHEVAIATTIFHLVDLHCSRVFARGAFGGDDHFHCRPWSDCSLAHRVFGRFRVLRSRLCDQNPGTCALNDRPSRPCCRDGHRFDLEIVSNLRVNEGRAIEGLSLRVGSR